MRWFLAALFGVAGGIIAIVIFHEPGSTTMHEIKNIILVMGFALGFVIGSPAGYFLGLIIDALVSKNLSKHEQQVQSSEKKFAPQIVGSKCFICGNRIMLISDARCCSECDCLFHFECLTNHACPRCGEPG